MTIPKAPELLIPPGDPFANDELKREEVADNLTTLLRNVSPPYVLAINSPWGSGKTTFLKMWERKLVNHKYKAFIYNAWENDFVENPFLSFIGQLNKYQNSLSAKDSDGNTFLEEKWEKAKEKVQNIIKNWTSSAIQIGGFAVGADPITAGALGAGAESLIKDYFKSFEKREEDLLTLKEVLEEYVIALNSSSSGEVKPFVIFIDELDRCRPLFAIQLLECIKHLFDIPGIVFILALDIEQLGYSLKTIYGNEMDVGGYLQRFFDQEFNLPVPKKEDFIEYLFKYWQLGNFLTEGKSGRFLDTFKPLSEYYNFQLRDLERGVFYFYLFLLTLNPEERDEGWFPEIIAFLIIVKIKKSSLYKQIRGDEISNEAIIPEFQKKYIGS